MASSGYDALAALQKQTLGADQDEEAVTVNTRALIDKVLARYAGEFTVLRELIQNAADANASNVTIKLQTLPSRTVPVPQSNDPATLVRHTVENHTMRTLLVQNNGQVFGEDDWVRLKRIAEGNPDEAKIGAFGVGFYSVFSECEEPFISSGKEALAFYWKGADNNQLFTKRVKLPESQSSNETSFLLPYRNTTSSVPALFSLCRFLAISLTFVGLSSIELWLDEWKILSLAKTTSPGQNVLIPSQLQTRSSEGLMQVKSVVRENAQIQAVVAKICGWKGKSSSNVTTSANQSVAANATHATNRLKSFFSKLTTPHDTPGRNISKSEVTVSESELVNPLSRVKATIFLNVNTASVQTSIPRDYAKELERATKKPPPKTTRVAVLISSSIADLDTDPKTCATEILSSVLPSKASRGRIFIGFPTQQTSGLQAHISAPAVIPTVERESIDLNSERIRTFNTEMLRIGGIVMRIAWLGEMESLKNGLSRQLVKPTDRLSKEMIAKVLPEATHVLNQFTFDEATPNVAVGALLEEGFWTANKKGASIEILSSQGILPSESVRTVGSDDLSFVDGIPFLPEHLVKNANGFVQRLIDYGIITSVTITDIHKELENKALNSTQLVEFLRWLSHKAWINEVDGATIRSLLNVAVANDEGDESNPSRVIMLGDIKNVINPTKIPLDVPIPSTTIPFRYTKSLNKGELNCLGWEELQLVPFVRYLLDNVDGQGVLPPHKDLTQSSDFAAAILPIISKQYDGLSQSSKSTIIDLLKPRTVIPTRLGMKKPGEAYFPAVAKIFEDLPTIHGLNSVKEKFLSALGVRKSIEIDLILTRLMTTPGDEQAKDGAPAGQWSHIDLIKYLASVYKDIPSEDLKRLRELSICPADVKETEGGSSQRFRVSDLYEPNESLRNLRLRLLQWPGVWREGSIEARFLYTLGLRKFPPSSELVKLAATAQDLSLRDRALRYLIDHHQANGYTSNNIADEMTPFIPVEGQAKSMLAPSECFTNEKASILQFPILRKDLHPHATKLGVRADPTISQCVNRLLEDPPRSRRNAREVFGYFASRVTELSAQDTDRLSAANIIPITSQNQTARSEKPELIRLVAPRICFLGDEMRYAELFDYVDFGQEANIFLLRIGAKHEPSTVELAALVVREPARIFGVLGIEGYMDLLRRLAALSKDKANKAVIREIKKANSKFLLAYTEINPGAEKEGSSAEKPNEEEEDMVKQYSLASADQIVIIDDLVSYNLFRSSLVCAPLEDALEDFYISLGTPLLSDLVEEQYNIVGPAEDTAEKLQKTIFERSRIFLHEYPRDAIKHDVRWLEKQVRVRTVIRITLRRTLKKYGLTHKESRSAAVANDEQGNVLCVTPTYDLYQVSQVLLTLLLSRPKPRDAMMLEMLLSTDLYKLRARGYNVEKILRQKAVEKAKIAEQSRRSQLEQEQQALHEREAASKESQSKRDSTPQRQLTLPGQFPRSPEDQATDKQVQQTKMPRGIFSELGKRFGIEYGQRALENGPTGGISNIPENGVPPPPYSPEDAQRTMIPQPESPTATHQVQSSLLKAIESSRAYGASSLVSQSAQKVVSEVKESRSYCDSTSAQNIQFAARTSSAMSVYVDAGIDKKKFLEANTSALNAFASLLLDIASVFSMARTAMHIFYDNTGSTIGFNSNHAVFLNYRYFEKLHLPMVQQGYKADALIYWFVVVCHELAHNLEETHSATHSYFAESFVIQYFSKIAQKSLGDTSLSGPVSSHNEKTPSLH